MLFALNGLQVIVDKQAKVLNFMTMTMELVNLTATSMGLNFVADDIVFSMGFELSAGTWEIINSTYSTTNVQMHPSHRIMAAEPASFACLDLRFKVPSLNVILILENVQIQPRFETITTDFEVFGRGWQCVSFFSAGIWGGLFIAFLFLFILSIGITAIMSIKTMTKFDDPKGKQITINASD